MSKKINQQELLKKAEERAKKKAQQIKEKNNIIREKNEKSDSVDNTPSQEDELNDIDDNINDVQTESLEQEQLDITDGNDIPDEIQEELGQNFIPDLDVPEDDFDPLNETVVERSYTDGNIKKQDNANQPSSAEQQSSQENTIPTIEATLPEPEIKSPSLESGEFGSENNQLGSESQKLKNEFDSPNKDNQKKEPINSQLDDLSPAQKRRAAEKTADALITTYAQVVPVPFKYMSSFNMRKLEKRHMNDEVDMYMQVLDDGTRVVDYCEDINSQAEKIFVVTDEMKQEIREPLIEVLLEKGFALTPSQRLMMAIGGQILQMGITSIQFLQQNKSAMQQFMEYHQKSKEEANEKKVKSDKKNEDKKKSEVVDDVKSNKSVGVSDTSTSENTNLDIPTSEDNSGISVEEYLNED